MKDFCHLVSLKTKQKNSIAPVIYFIFRFSQNFSLVIGSEKDSGDKQLDLDLLSD
jgi:hypothetical protein